jgi:hypothetical protein
MSHHWKVEIHGTGRGGTIDYDEGDDRRMEFDREIGGARDIIFIIAGPEPLNWDQANEWAAGRRDEIMQRVAAEVIRQRAANCVPDIHPRSRIFYVRKPPTKG